MSEKASAENRKLGVLPLVAIVLGSSIGSGIYDLPSDMSAASAPGPALIAWLISGAGMLCMCLATARLFAVHPTVRGIYGFATEGFGKFCGYVSGWGYYVAALVANVAFATMLMICLSYFFPILGDGANVASLVLASLCTWALFFIVNRGIESATILNAAVTVCKIVPLFVFVVAGIACFNAGVFTADFWGTFGANMAEGEGAGIAEQCQNCLVVILWVFVGVEAAAMMSDRAKSKSVAGRATILGVVCLLAIYILISMIPYGMMPREELAALPSPILAYLLEAAVGPWGTVLVMVGMIISISGAWLSWTIIPAEVSQGMAQDGLLPGKFAKLNRHGAPTFGLLIMTVVTQLFLFSLIISQDAYLFCYSLAACAGLLTWAFVCFYQVKYCLLNPGGRRVSGLVIGLVGSAFFIWAIIFGAGPRFLLGCLIVIVGLPLYCFARVKGGTALRDVFTKAEAALIVLFALGAVVAVALIAGGALVV